jgi:hypothetical protein
MTDAIGDVASEGHPGRSALETAHPSCTPVQMDRHRDIELLP